MRKVNTNALSEVEWTSPGGGFSGFGKEISEELGREPASTDETRRHPFDVEISRIPAGRTPFPYHSHSHQWEFYHVISGTGSARHADGTTSIGPGDAFIFKPGEAHTFSADESADLIMYVVASNPLAEHRYYPDSKKWGVAVPDKRYIRSSEALDYFDGEETPAGA